MTPLARHHAYTFEEYLEMDEQSSELKLEYLDGTVWAMAGGSIAHSTITANVTTQLGVQLDGKPCRLGTADLRVRVLATGLATYPDLSVVCAHVELDPADTKQRTITNPTVLVEVLSPSTEAYDRGEKAEHYKKIASLQELVLIAQDQRRVEVWRRAGEDWTLAVVRDRGKVQLSAIECALDLDATYRDPLGQAIA